MRPTHTDQQLPDYDALIHLLLDDLLEMLDGRINEEEHRWSMTLLEKVQEYLHRQFTVEESGGYLEEVLEEFPSWQPLLRTLQGEHKHLLQDFCELRNELSGCQTSTPLALRLQREFRMWVRRFRNHQHREAQVLQKAYTLDVGSGE